MGGEVLTSGRSGSPGGLRRGGQPLLFPELPEALPTTKNIFFF